MFFVVVSIRKISLIYKTNLFFAFVYKRFRSHQQRSHLIMHLIQQTSR